MNVSLAGRQIDQLPSAHRQKNTEVLEDWEISEGRCLENSCNVQQYELPRKISCRQRFGCRPQAFSRSSSACDTNLQPAALRSSRGCMLFSHLFLPSTASDNSLVWGRHQCKISERFFCSSICSYQRFLSHRRFPSFSLKRDNKKLLSPSETSTEKLLKEYKINPNDEGEEFRTAVHSAAERGYK